VEKMRLNASMSQNVVTYTVEVTTDNRDGLLLPYLTANVKFLVNERHEVLLVPNAALRFTPAVMSDPPDPGSEEDTFDSARDARKEGQVRGTVWVPEGGAVRPVAVRIGLTDGSLTEVESEGLKEGTPLVVGELQDEANGLSYSSPFAPQFSRESRTRPDR